MFYNYVLGDKLGQQTELEKKMKAELLSENEANESYKFNGERCYFFYTPLKYTHWMMVTVVPCQTIDMIGVMYALRIMAFGMIAMLILVAVAYVTMRNRRY